jgi:hypothetical protein
MRLDSSGRCHADTKQVVIFNSYQSDRTDQDAGDNNVSQILKSGLPDGVQIFNEFNDRPDFDEANWMSAYLRQKYAGRRVDFVIAAGSGAVF